MKETWNWAICHNEGVSDRFRTRQEAEEALFEYPEGGTVQYVREDHEHILRRS